MLGYLADITSLYLYIGLSYIEYYVYHMGQSNVVLADVHYIHKKW